MTEQRFSLAQRALHWTMAIMIIAMLFIGIGMVSILAPTYWPLISIHRPLGIGILLLVLIRIATRLRSGAPALPGDLPRWQAAAAKASHLLLYALMLAMPLVGWAMLSAGGYPVVLYGPLHLPPIAPHDAGLYALLRAAHTWLAYLLFVTILAHLGAALFHALVRRDAVVRSMTF
jgi:cytochrome b561